MESRFINKTDDIRGTTVEKKGQAIFNKKKYKQFQQELQNVLPECEVQKVLLLLCSIINFDPSCRAVPEDTYKRIAERARKQAAELGVTTYALHSKKYYENHKDLVIARVKQWRDQKKTMLCHP